MTEKEHGQEYGIVFDALNEELQRQIERDAANGDKNAAAYLAMQSKAQPAPVPQQGETDNFQKIPYYPALRDVAKLGPKTLVHHVEENSLFADLPRAEFKLDETRKVFKSLGQGADGLLSWALAGFLKQNTLGANRKKPAQNNVLIEYEKYARASGYLIVPADNSTDEKLRAKYEYDNVTREIKRDLKTIFALTLKPKFTIDGITQKGTQWIHPVRYVTEYPWGVLITFEQNFANFMLDNAKVNRFALDSLTIPKTHPNDYRIYTAMVTHFFIIDNHRKGIAQKLKVKTLLAETDLPTIDSPTVKKHGWRERMQKPLTEILDHLVMDFGKLETWEYIIPKGKPADWTPTTYKEWIEMTVYYKIKGAKMPKKMLEDRERQLKRREQAAARKRLKAASKVKA